MAFNEKELQIIQWGIQNGKSKAETQQAITNFRLTGSPSGNKPQPLAEPSFATQVKEEAVQRADRVGAILNRPESSVLEKGTQVFGQGVGLAASTAEGAVEQIPGVKSIFETIGSGIKKLSETAPIKAIGDFIGGTKGVQEAVQLYDTDPNFKDTVDAVANIGRIAADIEGAAGVTRGVTTTARAGAEAVGTIAKQSERFLNGITETGTAGITRATENAFNPSNIMQRVARIPKGRQAEFQKVAKESIGEYLVNRGIFGDIDEITSKLFERFSRSKAEADKGFASLKGNFKNTAVGNALKQLVERERGISSPGAVSRDLERIVELQKLHNGRGLTMSEINEVKRFFERNVKLDFLRANLPDKVAGANTLDSAIREFQFNKASELGFKNIQEINRETRLAKQLLDDLGKEYAGSAGNNAISLTDWIVLSGGTPASAAGFITKKALSSRGLQSRVAERLAPEPTVGIPKAILEEPTVDGFINFLKSIEGDTKNIPQ